MTEWNKVKEFINTHEIFTRKDFYKYGCNTTGEQYLVKIRSIGFVERTDIAEYKRIYKIPDTLSTTKINKLLENKFEFLKYIRYEKLKKLKNHFTE